MKTQEKHIYHGAALTQIVEHGSFKALNRASGKYGHYLVNTDRHVFVKYRKGSGSTWTHTFTKEEIDTIRDQMRANVAVLLCLVCDKTTVCALNRNEIENVLDLNQLKQQWVRVSIPRGGSCHVSGSNGTLARSVPHNSFPDKLFA